jgi:hypothetical protein
MSAPAIARPTPRVFSLKDDIAPITSGKQTIPNFKEVEASAGLASLALGGDNNTIAGWIRFNPLTKCFARYFLNTTQAGLFDGTGTVIFYDCNGGRSVGRIGTFAICQHEHVEGPGANHSRGWHPAFCAKCGLDLSVDSGD